MKKHFTTETQSHGGEPLHTVDCLVRQRRPLMQWGHDLLILPVSVSLW